MFRDQWIEEFTLWQMTKFVEEVKPLLGAMLEIGTWEGRSAVPLANAAYPQAFHIVDHFMGSATDGDISGKLAEERGHDIYEVYLDNVAKLTKGNILTHRVPWERWIVTAPTRIKFAHLDAEHGYEQAHALIAAILPRMVSGGIICGDDYHPSWDGTRRAVDELVPEREVNQYALWYYRVP